jgi:large subunit ribosomal protein L30
MAKKVKIELVRSLISVPESQKRIIRSLGLKKRLSSVERVASVKVIGELEKVVHLVRIEEVVG